MIVVQQVVTQSQAELEQTAVTTVAPRDPAAPAAVCTEGTQIDRHM